MKTRLLKITNMKRFCWWLDMNNVHPSDIDYACSKFAFWKESEKIFKRDDEAKARNDFYCHERSKLRGRRWKLLHRFEQGIMAEKLLTYIQKRYERKKAKRTNR